MSNDVGRPSALTEEMTVKIKYCILEGKNNKETAEELGIPYDTFEGWVKRNYDSFADSLLLYKHQRLLNKAERNLENYLDMDTTNHAATMKGVVYEFTDPKLEQVKGNITTFVSETLGRSNYHKKKELDHTGEFTTYEIIEGNEETDIPVSEATPAVAETSTGGVESSAV